jgi:hypothetical protein
MSEYATKIEQLTAENKRLMEKIAMNNNSDTSFPIMQLVSDKDTAMFVGHHDITRNGMKWTESELEQLITEAQEMKTMQEIAHIHRRSVSSIRYKFLFYGAKLHDKNIPIESIIKILPIKKKELIDHINKITENTKTCASNEKPNTRYIPYEQRGIILFDLNGTLCYRTKGPTKETFIRPCVRELAKLKNFYKLGIFTSMMRSNAFDVIRLVEDKCGRIFDRSLIFTREHTQEFSVYEQQTFNLSAYKTKKSLAYVLPELFNGDVSPNIKIIDDELVKIVEKDFAVVVPSWDGYSADTNIKELVEELTLQMTPY